MTNDRRGRWNVFAYYYAAALIGLVMVLVGAVGGLQSLVRVALPQTADEVRYIDEPYRFTPDGEPRPTAAELDRIEEEAEDDARTSGLADFARGLITAGVGAPVMAWHLRQARRKEPDWMDDGAPESPLATSGA